MSFVSGPSRSSAGLLKSQVVPFEPQSRPWADPTGYGLRLAAASQGWGIEIELWEPGPIRGALTYSENLSEGLSAGAYRAVVKAISNGTLQANMTSIKET